MKKSIFQLEEITKDFPAKQIFNYPKKYENIGVEFEKDPVWIEFDNIRALDDDKNIGRTHEHSQLEIQALANSFAIGVQTWQELPAVIKNTDSEIKFTHDQVFGFGRVQAIQLAREDQKGYWFWVLKPCTETQLSWVKVIENLDITPEFKQNEALLVQQMNDLLYKGIVANTDESIRDHIQKYVPHISSKSLGNVTNIIFETNKTPRRYVTWGPAKINQWLKQDADQSAKFYHQGKFDNVRGMYGFAAKNVMDPVMNSIKKYHETGKDSYVVLHVDAPNKSGNLKTFRKNQLSQYEEYKSMFTKLGMKHFPLHVLGFMYQDTESEDKRRLISA